MTRLVLWFGFLTCASALFAGDGPHLFYSRAFPGSKPDYIQIVLEKNGDAVYQEAVDDELPLKFKLTDEETQTVFGLADKLEHFKHALETPRNADEGEGGLHGYQDVSLRKRRRKDRGAV
jgi:hypothetical protein